MNVSLTPELEELIHEKVRSGMYLSASEVVREALRLLEERDELRGLRAEEIRSQIASELRAEGALAGQVPPEEGPARTPSRQRARRAQ